MTRNTFTNGLPPFSKIAAFGGIFVFILSLFTFTAPVSGEWLMPSKPNTVAVPSSVLSPVVGPLRVTSSNLAIADGKWEFNQHGTGFHRSGAGISDSNDSYAWDANWYTSTNRNADVGQPVYATAEGDVVLYAGAQPGGACNSVLIAHPNKDAPEWWSGYLHLQTLSAGLNQHVTQQTQIGTVGRECANNDHLHFVVYQGQNSPGRLVSVNANIIERSACGDGSSGSFRNPVTGGAPVHPNGTLIKAANDGTVYLIQNGQRRWVSSPEVLRALYQNGGFDFKDVITVAADELSSYSVGANITGTLSSNGRSQPEGRLIRQQGQGEVSIVTNNGMRRAFPNENIFLNLGYLFCNVVEVSDYYSYPAGSAVDGISLGSGGGGGGNGGVTVLNNGQSVSANLVPNEQRNYRINLPSGVTKLTVQITGSGDADLYVKYGSQASLSNYDCRPYLGSSSEQCIHNNPPAGDWYVMVNGYSSASYTLTATYQTGSNNSGAPCTSCTLFTGNLPNSGASNQQPNGSYYYSSTSGTHNGWLRGPAGTDFDLSLFKWNGSAWERVAQSESATENEQISYSGTSGYYTWVVYSYSGSGNYSFWLQHP